MLQELRRASRHLRGLRRGLRARHQLLLLELHGSKARVHQRHHVVHLLAGLLHAVHLAVQHGHAGEYKANSSVS